MFFMSLSQTNHALMSCLRKIMYSALIALDEIHRVYRTDAAHLCTRPKQYIYIFISIATNNREEGRYRKVNYDVHYPNHFSQS